jgi:hypothetical protein
MAGARTVTLAAAAPARAGRRQSRLRGIPVRRVPRLARYLPLALAASAACAAPSRPATHFGPLPPGAIDRWDLDRIRADIALQHLIDPALLVGRIPAGLTARTLRSAAGSDPFVASFLADHPELADHALGVLGFLALDSLTIGGRSVGSRQPVLATFWWLQLAPSDSIEWRTRGPTSLTLGFWLADTAEARRARSVWPSVRPADVQVRQTDSTTWDMRLVLQDAEIRGRCRLLGSRVTARYPLPAYTTLWAGDEETRVFSIWTFHGHRARRCEGPWEAEGEHPLAVSVRRTPADYPTVSMHSVFQDGWSARAGVYRRR